MSTIDVTVPLRPGMPTYPGNPGVRLARAADIGTGARANVSALELGVHSGTHVDAPVHTVEEGAGSEDIPLDVLVGEAVVVDATAAEREIGPELLGRLDLPDGVQRLLLKTRNAELWDRSDFDPDFVRLSAAGAAWLGARGVRLIGIDYLSIGDAQVHATLVEHDIVPLEGLDLRRARPGRYRLVCLPLAIEGADGAPARAVLEPMASEEGDRRPIEEQPAEPAPSGEPEPDAPPPAEAPETTPSGDEPFSGG